jgi:hypothetical protein
LLNEKQNGGGKERDEEAHAGKSKVSGLTIAL